MEIDENKAHKATEPLYKTTEEIKRVNLVDDETKTEYILKPRRNGVASRLSDVKLSAVARAIDPNLAATNLFTEHENSPAVLSERVITPDEQFIESEFVPGFTAKYNVNVDPIEHFANLNLKNTLKTIYKQNMTPEFRDRFIQQWLLANALGIGDMFEGNNIPLVAENGTRNLRVGKQYDFECGMHILTRETEPQTQPFKDCIFDEAYPFYEKGLAANNIDYIKQTAPDAATSFFDRLLAVKANLATILDFTKCEPAIAPKGFLPEQWTTKRLEKLSESATKNYAERFTKLADQYTRGE